MRALRKSASVPALLLKPRPSLRCFYGSYFGIPAGNFLGSFAAATLITAVAAPTSLPLAELLVVYALTWLLETIAQLFFWQLPGPAVGGFLAVGIFVVSVARTLFRTCRPRFLHLRPVTGKFRLPSRDSI